MSLKYLTRNKIAFIIQLVWIAILLIILRFHNGYSIAYLGIALESFLLLFYIFLNSVPNIMEKVMRSKGAKNHWSNAFQFFKGSFILDILLSICIGCIVFIISDYYMFNIFQMPYATISIQCFSIFFVLLAIILIFQGFFQGIGSFLPTIISSVLYLVIFAIAGLTFTLYESNMGQKISALLQNGHIKEMYLSFGTSIAITISCIPSILFLLVLYLGAGRRFFKENRKDDEKVQNDSLFKSSVIFLKSTTSVGFPFFLIRLPVYLGILLYNQQTNGSRIDEVGHYYAFFEILGLFFFIIFSYVLQFYVRKIKSCFKKNENQDARGHINIGIFWIFLVGGLILLLCIGNSKSISQILFPNLVYSHFLYILLGIQIILTSILIFFINIQHILGLKRKSILNILFALLFFISFIIIALNYFTQNVYVLAIGRVGALLLAVILNYFSLKKKIVFHQEILRTILFPILASFITGGILFVIETFLWEFLGNWLMFIVNFIVGLLCYFLCLSLFRCFQRKELKYLPLGTLILKIGSSLHIL